MIEGLILIRGAGEIASGVAYRLVKAGYPVVMTDSDAPQLVYSTISYGMCIAYTSVIIEGIIARRVEVDDISATLAEGVIPVLVDPDGKKIEALHPHVIVDTWYSALNIDDALVIRVESELTTTSQRCILDAPVNGILAQYANVGEFVAKGQRIAQIGVVAIYAPADGVLRGMMDYDTEVTTNLKIADLDPYGARKDCFTIPDQALAVGDSVLERLQSSGLVLRKSA